jgi:hypothetical protein
VVIRLLLVLVVQGLLVVMVVVQVLLLSSISLCPQSSRVLLIFVFQHECALLHPTRCCNYCWHGCWCGCCCLGTAPAVPAYSPGISPTHHLQI